MKNDAYTKFVLTVIALCLLVIASRGLDVVPKAHAAGDMNYATVPLNEDGSMNVRIVSFDDDAEMSVDIESCSGCPLGVKVKNQVEVIRVN